MLEFLCLYYVWSSRNRRLKLEKIPGVSALVTPLITTSKLYLGNILLSPYNYSIGMPFSLATAIGPIKFFMACDPNIDFPVLAEFDAEC